MKYIFIIILLMACTAGVALAQAVTWTDINGALNYSLLHESGNGTIFATYGTSPSANSTYGLYYSTDVGLTWSQTPYSGDVDDLAGNGDWVLFEILGTNFNTTRYFSGNNGTSWTRMTSYTNAFDFNISDTGAISALTNITATSFKVITYKPATYLWLAIGNAFSLPPNDFPVNFRIDKASNFFVGTFRNGLFVSTNKGNTWNNVLSPSGITSINVTKSNKILVGATYTDTTSGGVYLSSDTGKTFSFIGLRSFTISDLIEDNSGKIYANTNKGVYRYDSATTWHAIGPLSAQFDGLIGTQTNILLATGASTGFYRSTNFGSSWILTTAIRTENVSAVFVDPLNNVFVGTLDDGIFNTATIGSGWAPQASGLINGQTYAFDLLGTSLFAGTDNGLLRTTDHGQTWNNVTSRYFGGSVFDVAVNTNGDIYAGTLFGMYRSTDTGETWSASGLSNHVITQTVTNRSGIVFAASENDGVYRSANNGQTWSFLGLADQDIASIAINGDGELFVGGFGIVFQSTNNGSTWMNDTVGTTSVLSLATKGHNVFAGTYNGIYSSPDEGATWSLMDQTGLSYHTIMSLAFDNTGNLLAGTYGGGAYRTEQTITGVGNSPGIPVSMELFQNYPNPFNPSTIIGFKLAKFGNVALKIYNLLGQEIATLLHDNEPPGKYTIQWDAKNVPSGVYFYTLQTGQSSLTKKMIVMH